MVHNNNKRSGGAKGSKFVCVVNFSLMEEIEGMPRDISPSKNAYETLQVLFSQCNNAKKLDLILKAHVISRCPPHQQIKKVIPTKRKNVCDEVEKSKEVLEKEKRNREEHSEEATASEAKRSKMDHPKDVATACSPKHSSK